MPSFIKLTIFTLLLIKLTSAVIKEDDVIVKLNRAAQISFGFGYPFAHNKLNAAKRSDESVSTIPVIPILSQSSTLVAHIVSATEKSVINRSTTTIESVTVNLTTPISTSTIENVVVVVNTTAAVPVARDESTTAVAVVLNSTTAFPAFANSKNWTAVSYETYVRNNRTFYAMKTVFKLVSLKIGNGSNFTVGRLNNNFPFLEELVCKFF